MKRRKRKGEIKRKEGQEGKHGVTKEMAQEEEEGIRNNGKERKKEEVRQVNWLFPLPSIISFLLSFFHLPFFLDPQSKLWNSENKKMESESEQDK